MPDIKFEKPLPFEEALLHLPSGYNSRALRAYRDKPHRSDEQKSLATAINVAFVWSSSKEGSKFWSAVYYHYLDNIGDTYKLPPLPDDDD